MGKFTILFIVAILLTIWIVINPRGMFGISFFGLTTYNAIPIPYFDLKIYSNGKLKIRNGKEHFISFNETQELLNSSPTPDFLIIATGYEGKVVVDKKIFNETFVQIKVMKTDDALKEFNKLKNQGNKVAAIVHSTC